MTVGKLLHVIFRQEMLKLRDDQEDRKLDFL